MWFIEFTRNLSFTTSGLNLLHTFLPVVLINVLVQGQSDVCVCNPEDADTGKVCANNGQTYESACDFRLKQGLGADVGIRCVGPCPCDDALIALGIDCAAGSKTVALTSPSTISGLEFCATNGATYTNENSFMCDQVGDATLAICCPGSCPCQLADCSRAIPSLLLPTSKPQLKPDQTLPRDYTLPPFSDDTASPIEIPPPPVANSNFASAHLLSVPNFASMNPPVAAPHPVVVSVAKPSIISAGRPMPVPVPSAHQQPSKEPAIRPSNSHLRPMQPTMSRTETAPGFGKYTGEKDNTNAFKPLDIQVLPQLQVHRDRALTVPAGYNPLTEALRTVPFRLFRHLYVLITSAAEGMKQIPMQIATNMQSRLPSYLQDVPVELAKSIQEALSIHFNSLSQQVKDTVETVRLLVEEDAKT